MGVRETWEGKEMSNQLKTLKLTQKNLLLEELIRDVLIRRTNKRCNLYVFNFTPVLNAQISLYDWMNVLMYRQWGVIALYGFMEEKKLLNFPKLLLVSDLGKDMIHNISSQLYSGLCKLIPCYLLSKYLSLIIFFVSVVTRVIFELKFFFSKHSECLCFNS